MIINLLINTVLLIFGSIFVFLPEVSIATLPYIGEPARAVLVSAVTMWNTFMVTFPYAQTPYDIFVYVIIPFEALILLARFFLGNRLPVNHV